MGYFPVKYDSRVVIYKRKFFIRLATGVFAISSMMLIFNKLRVMNCNDFTTKRVILRIAILLLLHNSAIY